jgi:hypothetical protein
LHALYLDFDFKVGFTKILGAFGLGISQAKSVFLNKIAGERLEKERQFKNCVFIKYYLKSLSFQTVPFEIAKPNGRVTAVLVA